MLLSHMHFLHPSLYANYTPPSLQYTSHIKKKTKKNNTDVLQAADQDNKFFFYEVYEDAAAIDFHKTQPHYAAWGTFKESGGTISSVSKKASGKFMT